MVEREPDVGSGARVQDHIGRDPGALPDEADAAPAAPLANMSANPNPAVPPPRALVASAAEFVSCRPEESPVLCETAVFDPEPAEEALGSLYLVLETLNVSPESAALLEAVSATLRTEYYRDRERARLPSLEAALDAVNHTLGDRAEAGDTDWVDHFHAAVVAFRGTELHISKTGDAVLLLARKHHLTDIGEGLSDPRSRRPLHPFTSVASGTLAESDTLVLATPQLLHLVPRDRLRDFLTDKRPTETVARLRALLDDAREEAAFGLLLLQFTRMPERLPALEVPHDLPPRASPTPRASAERRPLLRPRRPIATETSLKQNLGRIAKHGSALLWHATTTRVLPALVASARWSFHTGRRLVTNTSGMVRQTSGALRERRALIPTAGGSRVATDTRRAGPRFTPSVIAARLVQLPAAAPLLLRRSFQSLPRSARLSLVIAVVLGVLFTGSLVALSRKRQEDAAIRAAVERLQEGRVKKENADAALIYDNTDQARQLLAEARAAAGAVAQTDYYQEDVGALLAGIQETEDRIEKVTRVPDPQVVGDFASVAPSLQSPGLVAIGTAVYTFNAENNAIYRLNTENGETTVVSQTSQGVGYFRAAHALPADKMILFATDSPGLALFDAERGDIVKQEIKLPDGVKTIRALGTFGSRLYLLAPEQKMIYGYAKTLAGYEGGTPWLTDPKVPADKAVAMGIDGYIYLLTEDGTITKLLKGAPVDFKQSRLTQPPQNPTRLLITEELKHLYVLDPRNRRILVYDTTGNLTRQLVLPNATDLRDITVKGKEEALIVLNGTQVYTVALK